MSLWQGPSARPAPRRPRAEQQGPADRGPLPPSPPCGEPEARGTTASPVGLGCSLVPSLPPAAGLCGLGVPSHPTPRASGARGSACSPTGDQLGGPCPSSSSLSPPPRLSSKFRTPRGIPGCIWRTRLSPSTSLPRLPRREQAASAAGPWTATAGPAWRTAPTRCPPRHGPPHSLLATHLHPGDRARARLGQRLSLSHGISAHHAARRSSQGEHPGGVPGATTGHTGAPPICSRPRLGHCGGQRARAR